MLSEEKLLESWSYGFHLPYGNGGIRAALRAVAEAAVKDEREQDKRWQFIAEGLQKLIEVRDRRDARAAVKDARGVEYREACALAMAIYKRRYMTQSPKFELCPDAVGVITQIDNMVAGLFSDLEAVKDAVGGDEPVAWVNLAPGFRDIDRQAFTDKANADFYHEHCYDLTAVYTRPKASAAVPDDVAKDAERYRWLKSRMVGVNFDWDDEGMTALAFEMPDNLSFCADCDKNIDSAILVAASQPEVRNVD